MKILFLTDVIMPPLTGIGRYAYEVANQLKTHPEISDIRYFHNCKFIENPKSLINSTQFFTTLKKNMPMRHILRPLYFQFRKTLLNIKAKPFEDYILHSPNYYLFPFAGPKIVTIHDISHVRHPECHPKDRVRFLKKHIPKAIENAAHIFTVSEFSKREIVEHYGVSEDFVSVTPNGVSNQFKIYSQSQTAPTLKKYKLKNKSYILSVATFEPRKNLLRLVDAYSKLSNNLKKQFPLVLIGASGWENKDLFQKINKFSNENIKFLGYVSEVELPHIYSGATVFAYPSLYEGFGIPILEAMSSSLPVMTSNSSSCIEVAGDACILVDPMDTRSITKGLENILVDESLQKKLIQKSQLNLKRYSWQICTNKTVEGYKKLSLT